MIIPKSSPAFPRTSARLASLITDETGTGALVFNTSPTLVSPVIGAATGTSLQVAAGTALAPSLAFSTDTDTGLFSVGADNLGIVTGGVSQWSLDSNGNFTDTATNTSGRFRIGNGSVAFPALSFSDDTNSGLYSIGADNLGLAVNGTKIVDVATTGVTITGTTTATTGFIPDADDGAYLGQSGTAFSDLFLASGAVINFAAGDIVLTHSSNLLTLTGGPLVIEFGSEPIRLTNTSSTAVANAAEFAHIPNDGVAANDGVANFFTLPNDAAAEIVYGQLRVLASAIGAGVETGRWFFRQYIAGTDTQVLSSDDAGQWSFPYGITNAGDLNFGSGLEVTIASGAITVTRTYHTVDTEGDTGTDDLITINGGTNGDILILRSNNSGRDTTVRDVSSTPAATNILLTGSTDFVMTNNQDNIVLMFFGTYWVEISRSDNS